MLNITVYLFEWRKEKTLHGWCSLGIQMISAVIQRDGHTVYSQVFEGDKEEYILSDIKEREPDIVAFPIFRENFSPMIELAERIKELNPEISLIVGGHTASLYPVKLLKRFQCIDIVVCGEGEKVYQNLLKKIHGELADCRGIAYRKNGTIFINQPEQLIEDLDNLPFPDYQITEQMNDKRNPFVFSSISTSRGCLGNCAFCVEHRVSRKNNRNVYWRGRSPENIVKEIEVLKERANGKKLVINFVDGSIEDDDFREKTRLNKLISLLEEKDIEMAFSFLTRADSWQEKDRSLIERMRKIGLFCVSIGFESGSERALRIFQKRSSYEDNIRAYDLFHECGVEVNGFIIMYHPYSDLDMLLETAETVKRCNLAHKIESWSHSIYIYPDTRIFQKVALDGLILGTDPTGLSYEYAFVDGRVKKVQRIMEVIANNADVVKFNSLMESIDRAIQLFHVWKTKDEKYLLVSSKMEQFSLEVDKIIEQTQEFYYTSFVNIVNNISHLEDNVIDEWINYAKSNAEILDKLWLETSMNLLRKGIKLI